MRTHFLERIVDVRRARGGAECGAPGAGRGGPAPPGAHGPELRHAAHGRRVRLHVRGPRLRPERPRTFDARPLQRPKRQRARRPRAAAARVRTRPVQRRRGPGVAAVAAVAPHRHNSTSPFLTTQSSHNKCHTHTIAKPTNNPILSCMRGPELHCAGLGHSLTQTGNHGPAAARPHPKLKKRFTPRTAGSTQ